MSLNTAASSIRNEGKTAAINLFSTSGYTVDPTSYFYARMDRAGQYGKMINFSDNYEAAIARLKSATTMDQKIKAIQDIYQITYVDDCYGRTAWAMPNHAYMADTVHDSGLESTLYTPETAYLSK